jgi:hypothetical protein
MFPIAVGTRCDTLDCSHHVPNLSYGLVFSYCWTSRDDLTLPDCAGDGFVSKPSVPILSWTVSATECIGLAVENRSQRIDPNTFPPYLGYPRHPTEI